MTENPLSAFDRLWVAATAAIPSTETVTPETGGVMYVQETDAVKVAVLLRHIYPREDSNRPGERIIVTSSEDGAARLSTRQIEMWPKASSTMKALSALQQVFPHA